MNSKSQHDSFSEEFPYPILRIEPSGKIIYANPASLPILLEWGVEVGGMVDASMVSLASQVLEENVAQKIEVKHGQTVIELTFSASSDGLFINVFGQDITVQKLMQEQADFYKKALDQAAIVAITDKSGRITHANDFFSKISGYEKEELLGKDHRILNSGTMGPGFFKEMWKTIGSGKVWKAEICNRAKLGNLYWVDTTIIPFLNSDGNPESYMAIRLDITQRKKAESELVQSNKRLKEAEKIGRFGSWEWNLKDHFFQCSKGVYFLLNLDESENCSYEKFLSFFLEEDRNVFRQALEESTFSKNHFSTACRVKLENGSLKWLRGEGYPVFDSEGIPIKILGIVQDVTEKMNTEMELMDATRRAGSAARAKAEFLANMSHEIRTPMNGVIGMCNLLLGEIKEPKYVDQLKIIQNCGNSLLNLINDILDFSKIEAGKIDLENEPFNIHRAVEEVILLFNVKASEKSVFLIYNADSSAPAWVSGDTTRFRQVLSNLVSNAIKFTSKGGVTVFSKAEKNSDGKFKFEFCVQDTGIGIPENAKSKLFESFSQADLSTTRKYGGSGLGLAISKGLCEKMGGEIWFESESGKGTNFYFTIILDEAQGVELEKSDELFSKSDQEMAKQHPLRILIAEDNRVNQLVAVGLLEKLGYHPDVAASGVEVLNILKQKSYDLIFMDNHMPEMDGLEATKKICEKYPPASRPFIVALTASAMKEDVDRCLASGMNDFIGKPIQVKEVSRILAMVTHRVMESRGGVSMKNVSTTVMNRESFLSNYQGIESLVPEVIDSFLKLKDNLISAVSSAIQKKDAKELEISAHTLKGVVSNFFAEPSRALAFELEQMGKNGSVEGADELFKKLELEVDALCKELQSLIESLPPSENAA